MTIAIERFEQTYFIGQHGADNRDMLDEALIFLFGTIESISRRHVQHLGNAIEIMLACAHTYSGSSPTPTTCKPRLHSLTLKKNGYGLMAYLPTEPFWALPSMLSSGKVTHMEVGFGPTHYGSAEIDSIHFAPASRLTPIT